MRHWLEFAAAVLTGIAHLVFAEWLGHRGPYLIAAIGGWTAYIVWRLVKEPSLVKEWRIWRGTGAATRWLAAFGLVGAGALLSAGMWLHDALPWKTIGLLALAYPIWGLIQQFLLHTFVTRPLSRSASAVATVLVTSLMFGAVHAPDWPLAGMCLVAGVAWTIFYLRGASVVALGLCHGILGTLAYVAVLGRDPVAEYLMPLWT